MKGFLIMGSKIYFVTGLAVVMLISCNSPSAQENTAQEKKTDTYTEMAADKTVNIAEQTSTKPVHLTKQDFLDKVMDYEKNPREWVYKGKLPCLIDFYADWCAPCRITAPILEELAEDYAGKINIYKIDIQRERELAQVFGISGIPAFLYCPMDGNPSITSGIARTAEETRQMFVEQIESLLLNSENTSDL
jgi:thioredoxin